MSKQYLTVHTVDQAHPTEIFSLAPTPTSLISASGASSLRIHSTLEPTFPLIQTIPNAHKLGCHHVCTSPRSGTTFASVGFGGEIKIWTCSSSQEWTLASEISPTSTTDGGNVWAVALSADENYLAGTTSDGRIRVWDLGRGKEGGEGGDAGQAEVIQTYETGASSGGGGGGGGGGNGSGGGSFAMAVDLSRDGKYTASGHENGSVFVFNNNAGRMVYSLSGLTKPVRAVSFGPGCKRLAAAGNAGIIAIYDMEHGEHVSNLTPNTDRPAWITSLDWNDTGDYLLSGSLDGKVRVWDVARGVCVATHSETDGGLWAVRWLPRSERALAPGMGKGEMFCAAGANKSLTFYREATGI